MINTKYELIAEKLACDARLPTTSNLTGCAQACLSEWLQLLMVIENIKASKADAASRLDALVKLGEVVSQSQLVTDGIAQEQMFFSLRRDDFWNPQPATATRYLNVLHTLFTAMDAGMSQNMYYTEIGKNLGKYSRVNIGSLTRDENTVYEEISMLMEKIDFSWRNLNKWRMHYPHEAIIRAVMFHGNMMGALFNLWEWINTPFQELKKQALINLLQKGEIHEPVKEKTSAAQISVIREKIIGLIEIDLVKKMNAIPAVIGFSFDHPLQKSDFPLSISNKREAFAILPFEPETEQDITSIKFSTKAFKECVERGEITSFYLSIERKVFSSEYGDNFNIFNSNSYLPFSVRDGLYKTWIWAQDDSVMLSSCSNSRVNVTVMLVGLQFSHWLWQERRRRNDKLTTSSAVEIYTNSRLDITTKNSTVKQYYERMRSWCKKNLASTVISQLCSRAETLTLINHSLVLPLNIDLIRRYEKFIELFYRLTECNLSGLCDAEKIIRIATSLREFHFNGAEWGEAELKELLCKQYNIECSIRRSESFDDPFWPRRVLDELVALNIDIGWGDSE
ncbi:hypothetical protein HNP12_000861 [Aeromonas hydrophila]|uniref:hypothetical protein n=1 Tax=Aeromonas hydrophila TaxID=644 RepID=UPI0021683FF1|nr:hypothetical protein [Aeromonas hydrophila]MCS3766813.1 hypothetical protein [Aeromonas hydrophila]MCS3792961.1 hypothetical protein [Aeromonas hydrophila]